MSGRTLQSAAAAAILVLLAGAPSLTAQQQDRMQPERRQQGRMQRERGRQERAQSQQDRRAGQQAARNRASRGQGDEPARGHISGRIVRTKTVDLRGTDRAHLVVLLETRRGNRVAADLGPVRRFREAAVRSGDRVRIRGRLVDIGDRQVVIGRAVQVDGRWVDITRNRPAGQRQRMARVSGEVERLNRARLPGTDIQVVLALLDTPGRRGRVVASLGSEQKLRGLHINEGASIGVVGEFVRVGDQPVLVANRVTTSAGGVELERQRIGRRGQANPRQPEQQSRERRADRGDRPDPYR